MLWFCPAKWAQSRVNTQLAAGLSRRPDLFEEKASSSRINSCRMRSLSGQQAQAKRSAAKQATLIVNCCFISRESEWIRRALGEKPPPAPAPSVPHSSRLDSHIWFTAELKVTFPPLFTVRFTHLTLNICGSLSSRESYLCFSCLRPAVCCFSYYDSLDKSERVAGLVWRSWGQSPDLNSIKHLCQSRYHRTSVFDLNRINAFQLLSWPLEADSHVKMV